MIKQGGKFDGLVINCLPALAGIPEALMVHGQDDRVWVAPEIYSRLRLNFEATVYSLRVRVLPAGFAPEQYVREIVRPPRAWPRA